MMLPFTEVRYCFIGYCAPEAKPLNKLYCFSSQGHTAFIPLMDIVEQSLNG